MFGNLLHEGTADSDGDGVSDFWEYMTGTDPKDSASTFRGEIAAPPILGDVSVSWKAAPGRSYRVQYKDELSETNWKDLTGTVAVVGTRASIVDKTVGTVGRRFYRVTLAE